MAFETLPKGSVLYIQASDPLAMDPANNQFSYKGSIFTAPGQTYLNSVSARNFLNFNDKTNSDRYRRVSEHNRSEFNMGNVRIEQQARMSDGTLRKYFVADKKTFSCSWNMLPSFRNETVDGGWAAEDLKAFYESSKGQGAFNIKINPTPFNVSNLEQSDGVLSQYYTYSVMFSSCSFTVIKRGLQTYWNVDLSMEQV